jgi:ABC-type lipoprotein release transport system permease subunit
MRLFKLALRNLFRNLRRTSITLAAISFGLGMMIMAINLGNGQYQAAISAGVSSLAGHVVVQADGWQADRDEEQLVRDSGQVAERMGSLFPDATITRRANLGGLLVSASSSTSASLLGVEPGPEAAVNTFDEKIVDGEWLDDDIRGLVIGAAMQKTLGVQVGDKVVYMGQHLGADMTSQLFRVKGVFKTGGPEIDAFIAFAPLSASQEILAIGDVAHQVSLHLDDARGSELAAASVVAAIEREGVDVLWWREALPEMYALIQMDKRWNDLMMAVLGLIVGMGVLNTILMSVLERTREFGVLLAVGMRPRELAKLVLWEGAILGVVGTALGLAFGALLTYPLVTHGLDYTQFMGESMEYMGVTISSVLKAKYDMARMAQYGVAAVLFTTSCAIYPAWYVTKFTPVDAMRHT